MGILTCYIFAGCGGKGYLFHWVTVQGEHFYLFILNDKALHQDPGYIKAPLLFEAL